MADRDATAGTATSAKSDAPVKILLVDDQPGRLLTYRAILEPLGEDLVDARSGEEALRRLMADEFALILLDVNMPGMDGFETASLIHQHPRFEKTPIIFVTAVNVTDMDRLRGYKLGAVDYVMVPVIPEILRSKVAVLSELYRKRAELQTTNAALEAANRALQAEQERELEALNESLRRANAALGTQNVELHREIAERRRVETLLREADRRKDEFLATLAHELRNPLAPLQNALNLRKLGRRFRHGDTDTDADADAEAEAEADADDSLHGLMGRQLALLVRLIDDLLDVARISRSKLALRKHPTSLKEVVESAIETARPSVEQGSHELRVSLPDTAVSLVADQARLSQVFANLINNAAKYSESGGRIELAARVADGRVQVRVSDTGIGLAPEQLESIFELFSQVDTTIDRAHGGLGIGLTLVRQLTEMHGGRVSVTSDGIGHGASFVVDLPLEPVAGAATVPAAVLPDAATAKATPRRVLVVDDNRDAADTLAMMVEMLGHEVRRLYDPQAVLADVAAFRPDIAFLDIGMPGLSGYELARQLRRQPGGERMLLVAVTGWGQPDDRHRTRDAGFDQHLVKPPAMEAIVQLCSTPDLSHRPAEQADG